MCQSEQVLARSGTAASLCLQPKNSQLATELNGFEAESVAKLGKTSRAAEGASCMVKLVRETACGLELITSECLQVHCYHRDDVVEDRTCSFLPVLATMLKHTLWHSMLQCRLDVDQGCNGNLFHRQACPTGLRGNRQAAWQSTRISMPVL